ncbi:tetratricopeptide repeat protein [candidate division CSSED10-310 bacterium]|uniref:Tetratricopeptide repeat protein n=1 Tax=candidate division CSSED10-310 bacterium TaxID=2855610 RepID=A0ABV6YZP5_UNCC1
MTGLPQTIGPYLILEQLGQGGMGVVYRARLEKNDTLVALKSVRIPRQVMLQSIRREIHALARVNHPGIIRIVDQGMHKGVPWYAMELLAGKTLKSWSTELKLSVDPQNQEKETVPGLAVRQVDAIEFKSERGHVSTPTISEHAERSSHWTLTLDPDRSSAKRELLDRNTAGDRFLEDRTNQETVFRHAAGSVSPEMLCSVLTMIYRLCRPLAYLHGEGIVHRDLKPDNVLIGPDGMPVIVDFGLLSRFGGPIGREALEVEGTAVGTVKYMSPEQIRGQLVDARADLYSLGCMLYELLTGQAPFVCRSAPELLLAHLYETPRSPSELVSGLSDKLDSLTLRLLKKDPHERLGYAQDVAEELRELGARDSLSDHGPKTRPYVYRPGFSGRDTPLMRLHQHLNKLKFGQGGMIMLGGESGVGKTRLAMELGREAARQDLLVLVSSIDMQPQPLTAFRRPLQVIADRCRERGQKETERLLGDRSCVLALYEPTLSGLPGQEAYPEAMELPPEAARIRLLDYLTRTLEALSQDKPVLLIIDDLQWADELSLEGLLFLYQRERLDTFPLFVLGIYRKEELGDNLQRLLDQDGVTKVDLDRLDQSAVEAMIGSMLAISKPQMEFAAYLATQSEGNPFFVVELMRVAIEEQLLSRDKRGYWQIATPGDPGLTISGYEDLPLPKSLRDLIQRRMVGLSESAQQILTTAAIIGREASIALLRQSTGPAESELLESITELLRRQIVEETDQGLIRFVHDKIREVTVQAIEKSQWSALNRAVAQAIETLFPEGQYADPGRLGYHWEQAGNLDQARHCYLSGARLAVRSFTHEDAERLYRAYQALVDKPTSESVSARNELGEQVLLRQGKYTEALAEHEQAVREARALGDLVNEGISLKAVGTTRIQIGDIDTVEELYLNALSAARTAADQKLEANVLHSLGYLSLRQGMTDKARPLFEQALAVSRQIGDLSQEGNSLRSLAYIYRASGKLDQGRQLSEQALKPARKIGAQRTECTILGTLAGIHLDQGWIDQARQTYEQALAIARKIGDRSLEGRWLVHLAYLHQGQGRLGLARQYYEQALCLSRQIGDLQLEGRVSGTLAYLHQEKGRIDQARQYYERALNIALQIKDRSMEGVWRGNLGCFFQEQHQLEKARKLFEQALAIARQSGERILEGRWLGNLASLSHEQGYLDQARHLYEQALAIAREASDRRFEALWLGHLADLERFQTGNFDRAQQLVDESLAVATEVDDKLWLEKLLCIRGHIILASGEPGVNELLEQAQLIAYKKGARSESDLVKRIVKLKKAVECFAQGEHQPLFRGEHIEHITVDVRRKLVSQGFLTIQQARLSQSES